MDTNRQAVAVFNKLADLYQERFMDVNMYDADLRFFCTALNKDKAQILDIACGPGNVSRFLLSLQPELNLWGIDLAPRMIELAKKNNPTARFSVMDSRKIFEITEKQDAVVCAFGLPYLNQNECAKLIEDISNLLHPEGLVYLSTMEDDYVKSGPQKGSTGDEIVMHFYQSSDLKNQLLKNNLSPIYENRFYSEGKDGQTVCDLILIAKKAQ